MNVEKGGWVCWIVVEKLVFIGSLKDVYDSNLYVNIEWILVYLKFFWYV